MAVQLKPRRYVIVGHDAAQVDQMFKALWSGMTDALSAGNKAAALVYLSGPAQAKYGPVFDALMPNMTEIFATYSLPQFGSYSEDTTEYAVGRTINGAKHVFFIYFVRDLNGVWRLDSM